MTADISTSVVVASRNRPEELYNCLHSIRAAMRPGDELIVVDSASAAPRSVHRVAEQVGAKVIRTELAGSAAARNLGVARAVCDILAFTDDDAVVDQHWISTACERFRDARISAVVGPVFESGLATDRTLFEFGSFSAASDEVEFDRRSGDWFSRARFGAIGSGANLFVRRSAFESHGPFREGLGAGAPIIGDENYFLLTLIESGAIVAHVPGSRVHHPAQSIERLRDVRMGYVAYLLYVFLTRPLIRSQVCQSAFTGLRRMRGSAARPARRTPLTEIVRAVVRAPHLVVRALRIDRDAERRRRDLPATDVRTPS